MDNISTCMVIYVRGLNSYLAADWKKDPFYPYPIQLPRIRLTLFIHKDKKHNLFIETALV